MKAMAAIEIIGSRGRHKCEALIDTGFTGYLSLNHDIAARLGLELTAIEPTELANGQEADAYVVDGKVSFLDREFSVPIVLSSSDEALIGTMLLGDCELSIDFPSKLVRIVRKDI